MGAILRRPYSGRLIAPGFEADGDPDNGHREEQILDKLADV